MCKKMVFLVVVVSTLLLSGMTQAASIDVTGPGDTVKGVPDDADWPAGEAPAFVIDDDINTKYLHFGGDVNTTGIQVTASLSGKIVTGLSLITANDAPERDPVTFELYGSNVSIDGPYTLIASGDIVDFSQATAWPRQTKNETPISFENDVAYDHYQVLFTAVRVPGNGCCMQIAEVELLVTMPPTPWVYVDIGTSGGHAGQEDGTYIVRSDGHDIWGGSDGFGYVCRPMNGNGVIEANLASMEITDGWAKCGVMMRDTLDADSKHVMIALSGANGLQTAWRGSTGGGSDARTTAGEVAPAKIKLTRDGNNFIAEFWWYDWVFDMYYYVKQPDPYLTIEMDDPIFVGLAVCSHKTGKLCTAVYNNVTWPAAAFDQAWLPSPTDGTKGVPLDVNLYWMPGDSATSHDVYLGADDPANMVKVDALPVGTECYDPPADLAGGTWYYWEIVEQPGDVAGPTWSFKTERPGLGTIKRELYGATLVGDPPYTIGGTLIPDLTGNANYPDNPTWVDEVTQLDSPDLGKDNYGLRMQGYLHPETSGDYTFWIAGDDAVQLSLGGDRSCDAVVIAYHNAWTGYQGWDWYPEQKSAPIPLVGGQKYFIRALMKEGGGGDTCSVAWEGPDCPSRAVIDGYYLSPDYVEYWASNTSPANGAVMTPEEVEVKKLTWRPGDFAAEHDVYLGADDPANMVKVATKPLGDESYDPGLLATGKTYYWKVDAVSGSDVWEGCTNNFTVLEWVNLDIDTWGGSATYDEPSDTWTIVADGGDIWGGNDRFHFVYQTPKLTRDQGEIVAHVKSLVKQNDWTKAGVMFRDSLVGGSPMVYSVVTPIDGNRRAGMGYRDSYYGGCGGPSHGGVDVPEWVKLTRNGNTYSAYHSDDGVNWTHTGTYTNYGIGSFCYVGLCVTSHSDNNFTTAEIGNVSITTPDPYQAWDFSPPDGTTDVGIKPTLSWKPGDDAVGHVVYLGTVYDDVVAGTGGTFKGAQVTTSYEPDPLELDTTYYWAIDEYGSRGSVTLGPVNSFKTVNHLVVDDFESYHVPPEDLPAQQIVGVAVKAEAPPTQVYIPGAITVVAEDPGTSCLIAEWAFEDDYTDSSGSGFDGDPCGDATMCVYPCRGKVLSLDGALDYVNCGNPAALNFTTGDWSLSAWVKNTMTGTGDINKGCIVGNGGDGGGGHRYCLIVTEQKEGKVNLVIDDDNIKYNKKQITAATAVNNDVWHHVLGVRQGDTITIYTDGVPEASTNIGGPDYDLGGTSQHEVLIGAIYNHNKGAPYIYKDYAGLIDDVQIYNCALTEGNARYMAGVGNKYAPGYYSPMIVHYTFDEGSGDTAYDSTENHLDGAISGASWSGGALDFGGDGDYVVNNDIGTYLNGLDALSVSVRIQSDVIDTDKGFIIFEDPSGADRRGFRYDSAGASAGGTNVIKYGVSTASASEEDESPSYMQTTDWQHLVMTWQSGVGLKLYVNGIPIPPSYKDTIESGNLSGYTKLLVGKGGKDDGADESWDGRIDDVRVYACALTEGNARYLAGIGDLPLYGPLAAHYEFEGDLSDSSGNGHDGIGYGDASAATGELVLDGDGDWVSVGSVGVSGAAPRTIAGFAKASNLNIPAFTNVFGFTGVSGENLHFDIDRVGGSNYGIHVYGWERDIMPIDYDMHHLAATYDGTTIKWYGDGRLIGTDSSRALNTTDNINMGKRGDNTNYFPGSVDDVRIYDCELSYGQIVKLGVNTPNLLSNAWISSGAAKIALELDGPHWGGQAMEVVVDGSWTEQEFQPVSIVSCVQLPFKPKANWTEGSPKALSIWYKGDPNVKEVKVNAGSNGNKLVPDIDVKSTDWQEMHFALADFGVPLDEIDMLVMEIEEEMGTKATVYIDDVRLYPTRCVAKYGPISDLTGDCLVGGDDLRLLVADWLDHDYTIDAQAPDPCGLVAWYEFEGDANDSSGNGNHGTLEGDADVSTGVLELDGSGDYVSTGKVASDLGIGGNNPKTVTAWVYTRGFCNGGIFDVGNRANGEDFSLRTLDCVDNRWRIQYWGGDYDFSYDTKDKWVHFAHVHDGSYTKIYADGKLIVDWAITINTTDTNPFQIGRYGWPDSDFDGKIDDLRVYNYALSQAEVVSTMGLPDLYIPLDSAANLYDAELQNSKWINFKDYAIMSDEWLIELLFPAP